VKNVCQIVCIGALMGLSNIAAAQSYEDHMDVQQVLQDLDWKIQIKEKQLEVEKLIFNIAEKKLQAPSADSSNPQSEGNSSRQVFDYGQGVEEVELTEAELAEMERQNVRQRQEFARENAKNIIERAALIEVFQKPQGSHLQAIIATGNGPQEIEVGDDVRGWRVAGITLQSITFRHSEFDLEREIRHIR